MDKRAEKMSNGLERFQNHILAVMGILILLCTSVQKANSDEPGEYNFIVSATFLGVYKSFLSCLVDGSSPPLRRSVAWIPCIKPVVSSSTKAGKFFFCLDVSISMLAWCAVFHISAWLLDTYNKCSPDQTLLTIKTSTRSSAEKNHFCRARVSCQCPGWVLWWFLNLVGDNTNQVPQRRIRCFLFCWHLQETFHLNPLRSLISVKKLKEAEFHFCAVLQLDTKATWQLLSAGWIAIV